MKRPERLNRAHDEHISPLRLSMYADGEAPREELTELEAHLGGCAACSSRLDALRSATASLAALPRTAPSASVFDKVLAGARRIDNASSAVSHERMGQARGNGPRLREVRLPGMDAPAPITPTRRRSRWRAPLTAALPTIAALLLIALTAGLLMRSSLVTTELPDTNPTATIQPGDTLNATAQAVKDASAQLAFKPVAPTYLPSGSRLDHVALATIASGETTLTLTWKMSVGPLRTLRLREQPASAPTSGYNSPAAQIAGLAWQLSKYPAWRAMTQVEQAGWSGVEQKSGSVLLLLDAQPAPGAAASDVATELRLTSLSLDARYALPPTAIGRPTGSLMRAIATVTGPGGQTWGWDVTSDADAILVNATITSPGGAKITQITRSGAGVRLDWSRKVYQVIHGPTLYNPPSGVVTQIAYAPSEYLNWGQLWYLGPKTVTLPGGQPINVYDLYRVDTARPEHVYADVNTGAVVAISVDFNSPDGPGNAPSNYVSTSVCAPYTVTYSWIIFEQAAQSSSLFNPNPPSAAGWRSGAVSLPFSCGG